MKSYGHMFTGLLMSTFAYVSLLFSGIAIGHFLGYEYEARSLMRIGLDFLPLNVIAGVLGGYIGGSTRGHNGAMVGGMVAGFIAAIARLLFIFYS